MKSYRQILKALKEAKGLGYTKTHRKGPTGIGKTIEDLLGIPENNIPGPDGVRLELKSERKNARSMVTLFTKSPLPPKINTYLVKRFGYVTSLSKGRKILHTTVNGLAYNTIKGKRGFKAGIGRDKIELFYNLKPVCYWDRKTLQHSFETKLPRLLYVKALSQGRGAKEQFWFNEAWLLSGFSFINFVKLLKQGKILIDVRIGQYPNGEGHDHGTGFRVFPSALDLCFSNRKKVL